MKSFSKIYGSLITLVLFNLTLSLSAQDNLSNLIDFSLTLSDGQVAVDWELPSDATLDLFEVQRASTNGLYQTIAVLKAKAYADTEGTFNYLDMNPPSGNVSYRIKGSSANGKSTVFPSLDMDILPGKQKIDLSDLRVQKQAVSFHIENPEASAFEVQITSLSGQIISEHQQAPGQTDLALSFSLSSQASGMYFILVKNDSGEEVSERFLY